MSEQPRLLVVSPLLPYPLDAGGKLRMFHILKGLSRHYRITLLTLAADRENTVENKRALDFLDELIVIPIRQGRPWQVFRMIVNLPRWLAGMPAEVIVKRSRGLLRACARLARSGRFDAVQIEFPQSIQYQAPFAAAGMPVVLVAHDVSFVSHERRARVARGARRWFWSREARLMRSYEQAGWRRAARIVAMSPVDREIIRQCVPEAAVDVVANGVDTEALQPVAEGPAPFLVFVGWMRHLPNPDAVSWFLSDIWPLIRKRDPAVRFAIVGKALADPLRRRVEADDRVDYRGYVDDVRSHVGEAWISVVPLRIGSGTRLKILESMALGTPVVATSVGVEGIDAQDGVHLRIADTPDAFAGAVLELLADPDRRREIAAAAREFAESRYDWGRIGDAAGESIARAIEGVEQ